MEEHLHYITLTFWLLPLSLSPSSWGSALLTGTSSFLAWIPISLPLTKYLCLNFYILMKPRALKVSTMFSAKPFPLLHFNVCCGSNSQFQDVKVFSVPLISHPDLHYLSFSTAMATAVRNPSCVEAHSTVLTLRYCYPLHLSSIQQVLSHNASLLKLLWK